MSDEVSPEIIHALHKFGLISDEQASDAYREWDIAWDLWQGRWERSQIVWKEQATFWQRCWHLGMAPLAWRFRWIDEQYS